MTDPNEPADPRDRSPFGSYASSARNMGHRVEEHPVTPDEDESAITVSIAIYNELLGRDAGRGHRHDRLSGPGARPPDLPLTVGEHLEMLARGERIARWYRDPARVHAALKAGASWEAIAAATGATRAAARAAYLEWADGEHRVNAEEGRGVGLDDTEYAEALELATREG